jgi:hypothetical protein
MATPHRRLTAHQARQLKESQRAGKLSGVPPIHVAPSPTGTNIWLDEIPNIWAAVQSVSSGVYTMKEQLPAASGLWRDGTFSFVAREANGNTAVPLGTIVRAEYDQAARYWFFRASACT